MNTTLTLNERLTALVAVMLAFIEKASDAAQLFRAEWRNNVIPLAEKFWSDLATDLRAGEFHRGAQRAQSNMVGLFIGVLISAIVVVQVFIPVVNDAIASSNVSGTTKTILELLGLFAALLLLIALASPLMRRV
ncbi:hypothetical protein [Haloparvum sp. AD34]